MSFSVNTTPLLNDTDLVSEDEDGVHSKAEDKPSTGMPECGVYRPLAPPDPYLVSYFIFYLLGIVTLLPWNFFVTADDYWMYKFRDLTNGSATAGVEFFPRRTPLQASFTSYLSVASAVPALIFLLLNAILNQKICVHKRILGSLVLMLILFVVTLVFVIVDTDKWQYGFFILTLVCIVLLNVCSSILTGSIFGIAGQFCPMYMTAVVSGQALGGIFAAIAQILSLSIGASSVHSALVYFVVGTLTIILSIICYAVLKRSHFYRYHLYDRLCPPMDGNTQDVAPDTLSLHTVIRKVQLHGIAMLNVFFITLCVYPSVTVLIESQNKGKGDRWSDVYFVPVIDYLLFNLGDYLGRIIAGRIQKPSTSWILVLLSTSRIFFIPLLLLCNAQPRHYWPLIFDKDYEYIIILILFALSNGYLANLVAIAAPRAVSDMERESASSIMMVCMGIGLAAGSVISLLMVKIL